MRQPQDQVRLFGDDTAVKPRQHVADFVAIDATVEDGDLESGKLGLQRSLDSIVNVEFAKDLLYVRLDRVLAEVNLVGDFTVREPSGDEPDDLQLGVTQGDRWWFCENFICGPEPLEIGRSGR